MSYLSTPVQVRTWIQTPAGENKHDHPPGVAGRRGSCWMSPFSVVKGLGFDCKYKAGLVPTAPVEASRERKTQHHLSANF